jgi:hypothetical protein
MPNFKWYLPTFHGDILLERREPKVTLVRVFELTPDEEKALTALRKRATKPGLGKKPWASDKDFEPVASAQYRTKAGLTITLNAKIEEVQAIIAKALKPNRSLLSAVRFENGKLEEIFTPDGAPYRLPAPKPEQKAEEPVAAVTTAKPTIGCPMPDFAEADVRASRVLEAFLDPEQIRDYRSHNAFISIGADTGHRYMVANRESKQMLKACSGRQLFDLEEKRALCVHDWDVPPAEEMLALHLCLSLPGQEKYVRSLPATFEDRSLLAR